MLMRLHQYSINKESTHYSKDPINNIKKEESHMVTLCLDIVIDANAINSNHTLHVSSHFIASERQTMEKKNAGSQIFYYR